MRLLLALAALAVLCAPALGHEWYDPWCCSDRDCGPLADGAVRVVRAGYMVRLGEQEIFVPEEKARPSQDEQFHICLVPTEDGLTVRCFYAPPLGV
jgi:hypothetical protein